MQHTEQCPENRSPSRARYAFDTSEGEPAWQAAFVGCAIRSERF
jgi:hypothetical protein